MKERVKKLLFGASVVTGTLMTTGLSAFAETSDTGTGVSQIITDATAGVIADSKVVIASALSIGVVFFGARLLWSKFKSMAR